MAAYAKVSASLGFKNFSTKKAERDILFVNQTQHSNEHLAFSSQHLQQTKKEQGFKNIELKTLENIELLQTLKAEGYKNPLLFNSFKASFLTALNKFQSKFKQHLKNPQLFYSYYASLFYSTSMHITEEGKSYKNPLLFSSKFARLKEGRGELWRLKRCKRVYWEFFKDKPRPQPVLVCPLRPKSSRLPLPLWLLKVKEGGADDNSLSTPNSLDSRYLQLPLNCWNLPLEEKPQPNREVKENNAVIVENKAEFTINDQAVNVLSCSLNTDDRSFCWQCSISIYYEDYQQLQLDERNIIKAKINNYEWVFRLEDVKTVRSFNSFTVELTGRSPTAELGADYASRLSGFIESELYARQVVEQLLDYSEFSLKDWPMEGNNLLIANTVELNDKSPLAVITELAAANAGFVETLRNGYEFIVKPRYKVKAWEIAGTEADLLLPISHITEISTERQINSEYNAVRIAGNEEGLLVYRAEQDRSKEASIQQSPLYTEFQQMREKGIEILSDSGKHQKHSIKTYLGNADLVSIGAELDYVPLAELGEIWEIKGEKIKGFIRGIALNLMLDNEALKIEQTLELDEYISDS